MALPNVPNVLLVDADPETARVTREAFEVSDVRLVSVPDIEAAEAELMHRAFDAVVCDLSGDSIGSRPSIAPGRSSP